MTQGYNKFESMKAERLKDKFLNQIPTLMSPEGTSMWSAFAKMIKGAPGRKPDGAIETLEFREYGDSDYFVWLGHSSVFLQVDGVRIFVDPVFSRSTSPIPFLGPQAFEYTNGYKPDQFPELDIVLITHDHYDHLDKLAIKAFKNRTKQFIVPMRVGRILEKWGVSGKKIVEMDWSDNFQFADKLKITAQTGRHFSGRGLTNRNSTLWCSYVIESKNAKIFCCGDSGYGPHFKQIGEAHGPFDMAFMECGQYNENWPFIHMVPEQTVQAAMDIGAKTFVPIHWGKFTLSLHPWDEPPQRAQKEALALGQPITLPQIGATITL